MEKIGTISPGIYRDMRFSDYLAEPAMSASRLKLLHKSHRDFRLGLKQTPTLASGRLEHLAVLERDRFDSITVVTPESRENEKGKNVKFVRSGAHWGQFQAKNEGKLIISSKDAEQCLGVASMVTENPDAVKYLTGEKEVSIFWNDTVFGQSKMRCDCLGKTWLADLKRTASDLLYFGRTCDKYGYDIQAHWYLRGAAAVGLDIHRFIFVAYESAFPHDSTCQEAYAGMLENGAEKIEIAAENLKAAEDSPDKFLGKFPGLTGVDFPTRLEEDF